MKGKGKAKADGFDTIDVDASREDTISGESRLSDLDFCGAIPDHY
jgi:hypothetical protein